MRRRLLTISLPSLVVVFGVVYAIAGFAFAGIYAGWFPELIKSGNLAAKDWDFVHFSFVTQATVGYGDFVPLGWARAVAALQAFCGIALSSMFLGVVVFRLLRREAGIVSTGKLFFSPAKRQYRWRIFNRDAEDVINGNLCLRLLNYDKNEFVSGVAHDVPLAHSGPTDKSVGIFPHGLVWAAETVSVDLEPRISPETLSVNNVFSLVFTGEASGAGSTIYNEWRFFLSDIVCGELTNIDRSNPQHEPRELPRDWKAPKYALGIFYAYGETAEQYCRDVCDFRVNCQLSLAQRLRSSAVAKKAETKATPQQTSGDKS